MARRMIECKTWKSYQVGQLGFRQRILWVGLITTADDQGRGHAHPGMVRGSIFPYDEITLDEVQADIDALAELGLIILYNAPDGKPLYQVANWWRYQRPRWAWPSSLPGPEGWVDRERYRRGNEVIQSNWEDNGGLTPDDSGATVGPQWGHDGDDVKPAPSGSGSGSTSDSISKGADAPDLPRNLEDWIDFVHQGKGQKGGMTARLGRMLVTLWPDRYDGRDPPYSKIGKYAKSVNGAARLAHLLWQANAYRVTGDPLDYAKAMHKNGTPSDSVSEAHAMLREWAEED